MNFTKLICSSIILTFLFSCNSGKEKKEQTFEQGKDSVMAAPKENFAKGEVIDKVVCNSDASQSYALYLPSTYSAEKTYPVIYSFDAHGTGKLPVDKYKELAERYGYILAGSNNSKNGNAWEESEAIAEKLFTDVQNRLAINTARIYLLGFSGGARVANGITINNGSISGVICCGASSPGTSNKAGRNNYSFIGIVGTSDFNYTEMRKYTMVELAGHNIKNVLITFDGKHEWAPNLVIDEAFWWLELCEMRKDKIYKNNMLVNERIVAPLKQIDSLMQKKKMFEAYTLCKNTITFYDGLTDLTSCFKLYKSFQENKEIDIALKREEESWGKEDNLKQYYMQGFQRDDFGWWVKEISSLNQKIKTNKIESLMYKRVLSYLSLVSYMQASGALKQNAIPAANYFCKVYVLVDPTNSEAHYLTASVLAIKGNTNEAIKALNLAVKNGFDDLPRLQTDTTFTQMKTTKEFEEIEKKLMEGK